LQKNAREKRGLRNVGFRRGDVFELPFADGTFNVVWAKYLLQWLKEPKIALAELKRVTKPGGLIVSCNADRFVKRFLAHYDDPATCSFTSLYFTSGRV
jgi:ubiquinone/menaquinone biosynthesis C-methylase UbiE